MSSYCVAVVYAIHKGNWQYNECSLMFQYYTWKNLAQDVCVYASNGAGVSVTSIVSDLRGTALLLGSKIQ